MSHSTPIGIANQPGKLNYARLGQSYEDGYRFPSDRGFLPGAEPAFRRGFFCGIQDAIAALTCPDDENSVADLLSDAEESRRTLKDAACWVHTANGDMPWLDFLASGSEVAAICYWLPGHQIAAAEARGRHHALFVAVEFLDALGDAGGNDSSDLNHLREWQGRAGKWAKQPGERPSPPPQPKWPEVKNIMEGR